MSQNDGGSELVQLIDSLRNTAVALSQQTEAIADAILRLTQGEPSSASASHLSASHLSASAPCSPSLNSSRNRAAQLSLQQNSRESTRAVGAAGNVSGAFPGVRDVCRPPSQNGTLRSLKSSNVSGDCSSCARSLKGVMSAGKTNVSYETVTDPITGMQRAEVIVSLPQGVSACAGSPAIIHKARLSVPPTALAKGIMPPDFDKCLPFRSNEDVVRSLTRWWGTFMVDNLDYVGTNEIFRENMYLESLDVIVTGWKDLNESTRGSTGLNSHDTSGLSRSTPNK